MDQFLRSFEFAFGRAMGRGVAGLIVAAALLALVLAVTLIFYLAAKRRGGTGFSVTFTPGVSSGRPTQQSWQPPPDRDRPDRERMIRSLDSAQGYLGRFYLALLYVVMSAATILMAILYFKHPDDGNRQFMLAYGGVVYFIGMLGLLNQVSRTRERLKPRGDHDSLMSQLGSKIDFSIESSPQVEFMDRPALERIQQYLDSGHSLDEACAAAHPPYRGMNGIMQGLFRKTMEAALEHRRTNPD